VFLDTNVLVSAFASRGICADLFELVLLEHDLIVGSSVLRELEKALREKVKLPGARVAELVDFVAGEATLVVEKAEPVVARVGADDAIVLGAACLGQAEMFVTGDAALVRLGTVRGLQVVSPRQFWETLHRSAR
jgi:putative PIN family toxin of toxin-antitoxin system